MKKRYLLGRNAMFLVLAKAAYILASFVLFCLLVRIHKADPLPINVYVLAIAINNLFVLAVDFGVTDVAVRASAGCRREQLRALMLGGGVVKLLYAAVGFAILSFVVEAVYEAPAERTAIYIACAAAALRSFSEYIEGIAVGRGRSGAVAGFTFLQYLLLFAACWAVAAVLQWGILAVLWCYVAVMGVSLLLRIVWMLRIAPAGQGQFTKFLAEFLRCSPVFGVSVIAVCINGTQLYPLVISVIGSVRHQLGVFSGGQKFIGVALVLGGVLGRSLFAASSHALAANDQDAVKEHMRRAMHLLGAVAFAGCAASLLLGSSVARWVYDGWLPGSGEVLAILSIGLPVGFLVYVPGAVLPAAGLQWLKTVIVLALGAVAWPAAYFATLYWGLRGASVAYVAVISVQAAALFAAQQKCVGHVPNVAELWRVLAATVIATGLVWALRSSLSTPTLCVLLVAAYGAALIVLKEHVILFPGLRARLGWRSSRA